MVSIRDGPIIEGDFALSGPNLAFKAVWMPGRHSLTSEALVPATFIGLSRTRGHRSKQGQEGKGQEKSCGPLREACVGTGLEMTD